MSKLSSNEAFESIFFDQNGNPYRDWEDRLKIAINSLLPSNIIFEVNVYKSVRPKDGGILVTLEKVNDKRISNTEDESVFTYVGAVAQITYIYTMKNMTTLVFDLRLGDLGGR
jgi:hypothetical protein